MSSVISGGPLIIRKEFTAAAEMDIAIPGFAPSIHIENLTFSADNTPTIELSPDGGTTYDTAYHWVTFEKESVGQTGNGNDAAATIPMASNGNIFSSAAGDTGAGLILLAGCQSAAAKTWLNGWSNFMRAATGGNITQCDISGYADVAKVHNHLRIVPSTGTVSGTLILVTHFG